ncbi:hypothetical protein TNCV_3017591 [Trichonephila clavipes]|nr:hypothetical protein TNCV_3017591 [Trichonephila clavipes]
MHPSYGAAGEMATKKDVEDPTFPASVLLTEEASFSREGVFSEHDSRVWDYDNPYGTRSQAAHHFAV